MGVGPLEGLVVAGGAEVPGGADSPVVGVAPPVALRRHVQAERLGGAFPRHPEGGGRVAGRRQVSGTVDFTGQRRLAVVTVSGGGGAAGVRQRGVETLWRCRRGGGGGAGSGPGEGGGGGEGGGMWSSAGSPRQSAVIHRDAVEAFAS